jgi:hypothetical protein
MATFLRVIQSCLLAIMGGGMAWFAASDAYWRLLNPKYAWLTFLGGALLLIVAAALFRDRERRVRISELSAVAAFLGLALAAALAPAPFTGQAPAPDAAAQAAPSHGGFVGGSMTLHYDDDAVPPPEIAFNGREYTRLNLAELLAGEDGGWSRAGGRYAVQGVIHRTPALDAAGCLSLRRLFVYCCLADAVEVTLLVRVANPAFYREGAWVHVLGVLSPEDDVAGLARRAGGGLSSAASEKYLLDAVRIKEGPVEGVPFILAVRDAKPFEY